jgi:hypothetical protein
MADTIFQPGDASYLDRVIGPSQGVRRVEGAKLRTGVSPGSRLKENCVNEAMWLNRSGREGEFEPAVGVMERNGFCFLHLSLGTKLDLPGSNLREHRQSILNLEFLDFPMTEFLTVAH